MTIMPHTQIIKTWFVLLTGCSLLIYCVVGDQVVMTPTFFGSEPVRAHAGRYQGTTMLQDEQNQGLAMINALTDAQRAKAIIHMSKTGNNIMAQAFKDNLVLESGDSRVGACGRTAHAVAGLDSCLCQEHGRGACDGQHGRGPATPRPHDFAWIGGTEPTSVFYDRIQSPVILIEFDHQLPVGLRHLASDPQVVDREHIHTVVRTPNGNDYGKDLLRQHYELQPHPHQH